MNEIPTGPKSTILKPGYGLSRACAAGLYLVKLAGRAVRGVHRREELGRKKQINYEQKEERTFVCRKYFEKYFQFSGQFQTCQFENLHQSTHAVVQSKLNFFCPPPKPTPGWELQRPRNRLVPETEANRA